MEVLKLRPVNITHEVLSELEKKNLVRTLTPTPKVLKVKPGHCVVDKIYSSYHRFGTHKLICVGKNETRIRLTSHPDNEEFIFINTMRRSFKPLYLIIALHKDRALESKAKNNNLTSKDFLALRLRYNDPKTSVFTIFKNTPHCEVTIAGNHHMHPIFFVAEPNNFEMGFVKMHNYSLQLAIPNHR